VLFAFLLFCRRGFFYFWRFGLPPTISAAPRNLQGLERNFFGRSIAQSHPNLGVHK
jgi:hypothetical protein